MHQYERAHSHITGIHIEHRCDKIIKFDSLYADVKDRTQKRTPFFIYG